MSGRRDPQHLAAAPIITASPDVADYALILDKEVITKGIR